MSKVTPSTFFNKVDPMSSTQGSSGCCVQAGYFAAIMLCVMWFFPLGNYHGLVIGTNKLFIIQSMVSTMVSLVVLTCYWRLIKPYVGRQKVVRFVEPVVTDIFEIPCTAEDKASRVLFGDRVLFGATVAWNNGHARPLFNRVLSNLTYFFIYLKEIEKEQQAAMMDDDGSMDNDSGGKVGANQASFGDDSKEEDKALDSMDWEQLQEPRRIHFAFEVVSSVHVVPRTEDDEASRVFGGNAKMFCHLISKNQRNRRRMFDLVLADLLVEAEKGVSLKEQKVDTSTDTKLVSIVEEDSRAGADEPDSMDWEELLEPRQVAFAFHVVSHIHIVPRGEDDKVARVFGGDARSFATLVSQNRRNCHYLFDLALAELLIEAEHGFDLKETPKVETVGKVVIGEDIPKAHRQSSFSFGNPALLQLDESFYAALVMNDEGKNESDDAGVSSSAFTFGQNQCSVFDGNLYSYLSSDEGPEEEPDQDERSDNLETDSLVDNGEEEDGILAVEEVENDSHPPAPRPAPAQGQPEPFGEDGDEEEGIHTGDAAEDDNPSPAPKPVPSRNPSAPLRRSARIAARNQRKQALGSIVVDGKRRSARLIET